jgi:hypothetical protein
MSPTFGRQAHDHDVRHGLLLSGLARRQRPADLRPAALARGPGSLWSGQCRAGINLSVRATAGRAAAGYYSGGTHRDRPDRVTDLDQAAATSMRYGWRQIAELGPIILGGRHPPPAPRPDPTLAGEPAGPTRGRRGLIVHNRRSHPHSTQHSRPAPGEAPASKS